MSPFSIGHVGPKFNGLLRIFDAVFERLKARTRAAPERFMLVVDVLGFFYSLLVGFSLVFLCLQCLECLSRIFGQCVGSIVLLSALVKSIG